MTDPTTVSLFSHYQTIFIFHTSLPLPTIMQLKLFSVLFFVLGLCAYTTWALPYSIQELTERDGSVAFAEHLSQDLAKRTRYPVKGDADLAAKIMVAVKAKVKADIVAKISASVSEKIKASLDIKVKALLGIVSIGDAKITARQSVALKKVQGKVKNIGPNLPFNS